jgi:hypothetical protein
MEVFSYNEWLKGKVILKYDYFISKGMQPILVEWDNFSDADILLIKAKQKEIFNERVAKLLEKYKVTFNEELMSSKDTEEHRKMTVSQIDDIFKGVFPTSQFISTEYWNVVFSYMELRKIQQYYKSNIIRGVEVDYTFINSPNREYQKQDENHQVYTQTLYLFGKWVESLTPESAETKSKKLKTQLGEYGFFELPKVKNLSELNKQRLVELLNTNLMPYGIALFDFLGFCEHLDKVQGTKYKADKILSTLYNENAKDGTSAKHYRRSLIKSMPRYKAGEYKETVKTDYQKLK